MSAKFVKVNNLSLYDLENKLSSEGYGSIHWSHMIRELKKRAENVSDITKEGKKNRLEAQKALAKFKSC